MIVLSCLYTYSQCRRYFFQIKLFIKWLFHYLQLLLLNIFLNYTMLLYLFIFSPFVFLTEKIFLSHNASTIVSLPPLLLVPPHLPSPIHQPLFHLQRRVGLQETTVNRHKNRYSKTRQKQNLWE